MSTEFILLSEEVGTDSLWLLLSQQSLTLLRKRRRGEEEKGEKEREKLTKLRDSKGWPRSEKRGSVGGAGLLLVGPLGVAVLSGEGVWVLTREAEAIRMLITR